MKQNTKIHPATKAGTAHKPSRRSGRCVKTIHHPEGRTALAGAPERQAALQHRAMQLKIQGMELGQIGETLRDEFELEKTPAKTTVFDLVAKAFQEGLQSMKQEGEAYTRLFMARSEAMIAKLMPYAMGQFVVEREIVQDGERIKVIDAHVLEERIKACGEVRKQGESVLKALGITKAQAEGEKMTTDGMKMFILQSVTNHLEPGGKVISAEQAQTVLELRSGDEVIDSL